MTDIAIRISIAREAATVLPFDETRAAHALRVLDRYTSGDATLSQLLHAAEPCRRGLQTYAKQAKHERNAAAKARCKACCHAFFAVYDAIDRVADASEPTPPARESLFAHLWELCSAWLWRTPAPPLPEPTPYRTDGHQVDHSLAWWERGAA